MKFSKHPGFVAPVGSKEINVKRPNITKNAITPICSHIGPPPK